jgi:hypothetical protein
MHKQRSSVAGSALIMVLFVMTALLLYSSTVWHTTTYAIESMRARTEREQHARFIEAVLQWGIVFAQAQYKQLMENEHEVVLTFGPLPPLFQDHYQAQVTLVPQSNIVNVHAQLRCARKASLVASCAVGHEVVNGVSVFSVRDRQWS